MFRPARPRPTALLPPRSNGKPEATTAVYKLLMMGMRIPETCWAVFKRRAINLRDWCIWLVDLFKCMMMHGLANPKRSVVFATDWSLLVLVYFHATPSRMMQVLCNQTAPVDIWQHTVIRLPLVERRPFRCRFEWHNYHCWISSSSPPSPLVHGVPETNHVYRVHNVAAIL